MVKKAQSGFEFMMITLVAFTTLIVVIVILSATMGMKQNEQVLFEAEKVSLALRNELLFASQAELGYSRLFDLPLRIKGYDYEVRIGQTSINTSYLELEINEVVFFQSVPLTFGVVNPGPLWINKSGSFIEVGN
jgi:hypothetical protein